MGARAFDVRGFEAALVWTGAIYACEYSQSVLTVVNYGSEWNGLSGWIRRTGARSQEQA